MSGADDYLLLAERCSRLAIACSTPAVSQALMRLALHYLVQSHQRQPAAEQQRQLQPDPLGFGD